MPSPTSMSDAAIAEPRIESFLRRARSPPFRSGNAAEPTIRSVLIQKAENRQASSDPTGILSKGVITMRGRIILVLLAAVLGGLLISQALASVGPPWSLFGTATPVKTGEKPNPWAVELTSHQDTFGNISFGGVAYQPRPGSFQFDDVYYFGTDFKVVTGDCGAGSPRFQLNIDKDGDGTFDGNIFVYIGPSPAFTACDPLQTIGWPSTGHLVGNNDPCRYDTAQIVSGTQCNTYNGTQTLLSTFPNHQIACMHLVT